MLDQKVIAQLKAEHGDDLVGIECTDGEVLVFRKPRRQEFDRWFDSRANENASANARELAQATLVHPTRDGMIAQLDRQPALLMCKGGILDSITELAGLDNQGAKAKKL